MNEWSMTQARRIVVKVGSSLVTNDGRGLDHAMISSWAKQTVALKKDGREIILVSSGAIATGIKRLGLKERPREMRELQAAAAIGQMELVQAYETAFADQGLRAAQILLTHEDLSNRRRYLNARSTLRTLLEWDVVPIINENDTITTEEIKLGDNDTLGALVANLLEADVLILLTDQKGLYTADPRLDAQAKLLDEAQAGDETLERMAGGAGSAIGKGGMLTKVLAAKRAARSGAATIIANGREENVLLRLAADEKIGTRLIAHTAPLLARKQWLADQLQLAGRLFLDDGAAHAVQHEGKSLLAIGVLRCEGKFDRGEVVACCNRQGREIARGLVNYRAADVEKILRQPSNKIAQILGHLEEPELIHRDNLVLTRDKNNEAD
jgi:glutamate 5-kinase